MIIPAGIYGCETVHTSDGWVRKLEKLEQKMGRFITGASQVCSKTAINGEIGWTPVREKIAIAKLNSP